MAGMIPALVTAARYVVFAAKGYRTYKAGEEIYKELQKEPEDRNYTNVAAQAFFIAAQGVDLRIAGKELEIPGLAGKELVPGLVEKEITAEMACYARAAAGGTDVAREYTSGKDKTHIAAVAILRGADVIGVETVVNLAPSMASMARLNRVVRAVYQLYTGQASNLLNKQAQQAFVAAQLADILVWGFYSGGWCEFGTTALVGIADVASEWTSENRGLDDVAALLLLRASYLGMMTESTTIKDLSRDGVEVASTYPVLRPFLRYLYQLAYEKACGSDNLTELEKAEYLTAHCDFAIWLRENKKIDQYKHLFCPFSSQFMLHPVRHREDRAVYVEERHLAKLREEKKTSLTLDGKIYSLGSFENKVDATEQERCLESLKPLMEEFLDEEVQLKAAIDQIIGWRNMRRFPDRFGKIVDISNWPKCAITGKPIRFIVVPKFPAEHTGSEEAYYEKGEIKQCLREKRTPPRWPTETLPFKKENWEPSKVLQGLIDRNLREWARKYSEIKNSMQQTAAPQPAESSIQSQAVSSAQHKAPPLLWAAEEVTKEKQFLAWFEKDQKSDRYKHLLCPFSSQFMLHPIRHRKDRTVYVEEGYLAKLRKEKKTSLALDGKVYSLSSFKSKVDVEEQQRRLEEVRSLAEEYLVDDKRQKGVAIDQIIDWEKMKRFPDHFERVVETSNWPKCTITDKPIRFIVVPKLPKGHTGAEDVYYEREEIEQCLEKKRIPAGWPKMLPFRKENCEPSKALQGLINDSLREWSRKYSEKRGSTQQAAAASSFMEEAPAPYSYDDDGQFKDWLKGRFPATYRNLRCRFSKHFLLNPVQHRNDPNIYIEQKYLDERRGQGVAEVVCLRDGAHFSLGGFNNFQDVKKQRRNAQLLEALGKEFMKHEMERATEQVRSREYAAAGAASSAAQSSVQAESAAGPSSVPAAGAAQSGASSQTGAGTSSIPAASLGAAAAASSAPLPRDAQEATPASQNSSSFQARARSYEERQLTELSSYAANDQFIEWLKTAPAKKWGCLLCPASGRLMLNPVKHNHLYECYVEEEYLKEVKAKGHSDLTVCFSPRFFLSCNVADFKKSPVKTQASQKELLKAAIKEFQAVAEVAPSAAQSGASSQREVSPSSDKNAEFKSWLKLVQPENYKQLICPFSGRIMLKPVHSEKDPYIRIERSALEEARVQGRTFWTLNGKDYPLDEFVRPSGVNQQKRRREVFETIVLEYETYRAQSSAPVQVEEEAEAETPTFWEDGAVLRA